MNLDDAYDTDNIFAKILREELPSVRIYENEKTLAFMDIMPQVEGHVLVIPKCEATNLLTLPEDYAGALLRSTQLVGRAVQQACNAPGFMIAQLNGSAAGQTVPHIHMHILPRHAGIEFKMHAVDVADMDELQVVANKIKACL